MNRCPYWDCGWCYAPESTETNAHNGACMKPDECNFFTLLIMKNSPRNPQKIHISKQISICGSLESLSNEIIDALNEGYDYFDIEVSRGYYDSYDVSFEISGTRLETEEEVNRRLDAELKIENRKKARDERSKKLKEEREKKQYERLRKKFESSTQS